MLKSFIALSLLLNGCAIAQAMTPENLRAEYLTDPLALDTARPRLSWTLNSSTRADKQTGYQVLVASSPDSLSRDKGDLWDSGRINGDENIGVEYAGQPLLAGQTAFWKLRAWDKDGKTSSWSQPARFGIGLLKASDWKGQWIGMASAGENACPWLRREFTLDKVPRSALAYIVSIGFHELYVNGRRVGDQVLSPSTSDLGKRALYNTYDIRPYLKPGANVVGLWLAPGWSQFKNGNPMTAQYTGKMTIARAQLKFDNAPIVLSDETWRCSLSSTTHLGQWQYADFGGDSIDANRDAPGWNDTGFNDAAWEKATAYQPDIEISADFVEPNRKLEKIAATQVSEIAPGKFRFTLAKLFTGWAEIALKGAPGQKITIHSCSLPSKDEEFNQRDEYILGPTGQGTFCNQFSYHEIGYVTVEGLNYTPKATDLVGYRVGNDRARTGTFDCSNPLLKQIYDITVNTYENLSTGGITVDCPHRERLGYGGDAHGSLEIAVDTYESDAFFSRWAQDWVDIQQPGGRIAHTAPQTGGGGGPAWSGIIITLPWEAYQTYGDTRILAKTYPAAKKWLDYLDADLGPDGTLKPLPGTWSFLGDWVAPGRREIGTKPETAPFNNCYYLYVTRLAAKIATVLGKTDDANILTARADRLRTAINQRFLNPVTKHYYDEKQTRTILALISGAPEPADLPAVFKNLESDLLETHQGHIDTGLHGTYFLTKYLTEHNRSDLIYTFTTQTTAPSYGDLIAKGFTTWPEYWTGSDSRMHGCLNGIGGWFMRGIGGIRADQPGFKHFIVRPAMVGDLTWAKATFQSVQGHIVSDWKRENGRVNMDITVPTNTTATVYVPSSDATKVTESGKTASRSAGMKFLRMEEGTAVFEVESGRYHFEVRE